MGSGWRMPTRIEQLELIDNCTWTTMNGENGYRVTGPNGNSIFIPAMGYREGRENEDAGNLGCYWTSTATPINTDPALARVSTAICLEFDSEGIEISGNKYWIGYLVRPVAEY